MSQWQQLLDRTVVGLERLRHAGQPIPQLVLGGGTALMINAGHRISKDIDVFITDPQYLAFLSPRLGGESVWMCNAYDEATNHLKLKFPEGEIDFIVAPAITDLPLERKTIDLTAIRAGASHVVDLEHPVEIALKKLYHRGRMLPARDMFDIRVVDALFPELLRANLSHIAHLKSAILTRIDATSEEFVRLELGELDILEAWREAAVDCLPRLRAIIAAVPEPGTSS